MSETLTVFVVLLPAASVATTFSVSFTTFAAFRAFFALLDSLIAIEPLPLTVALALPLTLPVRFATTFTGSLLVIATATLPVFFFALTVFGRTITGAVVSLAVPTTGTEPPPLPPFGSAGIGFELVVPPPEEVVPPPPVEPPPPVVSPPPVPGSPPPFSTGAGFTCTT